MKGAEFFKSSKFLFIGTVILIVALISGTIGGSIGYLIASNYKNNTKNSIREVISRDVYVISQESSVIDVVEKTSDAVVSIVISQEVPVYEQETYSSIEDFFFRRQNTDRNQVGTEERRIGSGSGFFVSEDGLIITNRHVVNNDSAKYSVILNNGAKHDAEVIAKDTVLDIAFMKVKDSNDAKFEFIELGDSESIKAGQSVVAIGYALGEFSNTVSTGIISGLGRNIIATDQQGRSSEQLFDVIQTDASINPGNSGGPLLDLSGKVIGVNVAMANNAENIGFAIPVNEVINLLERFELTESLERPSLGVRFTLINDESKPILKELGYEIRDSIKSGAIVRRGENSTQLAVEENSPAEKAGIKDGDIILKVDDVDVNDENPLNRLIQNKFIDQEIELLVLRGTEEITINVKLESRKLSSN